MADHSYYIVDLSKCEEISSWYPSYVMKELMDFEGVCVEIKHICLDTYFVEIRKSEFDFETHLKERFPEAQLISTFGVGSSWKFGGSTIAWTQDNV